MIVENNQTASSRPSSSNSFGANGLESGLEGGQENGQENGEGRRNRNSRIWNALLATSAIGIFLEGCAANTSGASDDTSPLIPQGIADFFNVVGNFFDFFVDDNTPKPPSHVDTDIYIVGNEETVTIDFDVDGGSLLYRDVINAEHINFTLYHGNDAEITIGTASVSIKSSPALRNGLYGLHAGEGDDFYGYLYIGTSSPDVLTADSRGGGRLVGFSGDDVLTGNDYADGISGGAGNDKLYGKGGDDLMYGGIGDDLLQGGIGNDELYGEDGSDTYIFEAGDGNDLIRGSSDETGNKLLFDPLAGSAYADADFQFNRGFLQGGENLQASSSGSDLQIVVSLEGVEKNRVIIQDYFSTGDDEAYTIYRNSLSEDMIVSTIPAETS